MRNEQALWHIHPMTNGTDGVMDNKDELLLTVYSPNIVKQGVHARLITAAPELVEACEKALDALMSTSYERDKENHHTITGYHFLEYALDSIANLKQALAKVRGEEG